MMVVNGVNKGRKRRTIRWRFDRGLTKPLVRQMLHKSKHSVQTRHRVNLRFAYRLRNIENNEYNVYYKKINSHWFSKLSQTKLWLQEQEELRLQGERIDRPNTKWVFESTVFVDLKVILDRQALQIGLGWLPDWLRNKEKSSLLTLSMTLFVSFGVWLFIKEPISDIIFEEPEN